MKIRAGASFFCSIGIIALFLTSCGSQTPEGSLAEKSPTPLRGISTSALKSTQTWQNTPTFSNTVLPARISTAYDKPTGTPRPVTTPTSTPTQSPDILLPKAIPLCDAAFSKAVTGGTVSGKAFTLINNSTKPERWQHTYGTLPYEASSPDQVQALICINESLERLYTYTDGAAANRVNWEARVVHWPSGEVVKASPRLIGDRPPGSKSGKGPASGIPPVGELIRWMGGVFSDQVVFVHEPFFSVPLTAISPDGKILLTVSRTDQHEHYGFETRQPYKDSIKAWDIASRRHLYTISLKDYYHVHALSFSLDNQFLIGLQGDSTQAQVSFWSLANGTLNRTVKIEIDKHGKTYNQIQNVTFSSDASMVAISHDTYVSVFNTSNGQLISSTSFTDKVTKVIFSTDKSMLATKLTSSEIKIWQVNSNELLHTLHGACMVFSPDGKEIILASGYDEKEWQGVAAFDLLTGKMNRVIINEPSKFKLVQNMIIPSDSSLLVVIFSNPTSESYQDLLVSVDLLSQKVINSMDIPQSLHLVCSQKSKYLATAFDYLGTGIVELIQLEYHKKPESLY